VKSNKNDARDAEAICEAAGDRQCASCDQEPVTAGHDGFAPSAGVTNLRAHGADERNSRDVITALGASVLRRLIATIMAEPDDRVSGLLRETLSEMNLIPRQQLVATAQVLEVGETLEHRSLAVGVAVSTVAVPPGGDHHRPARDPAALASPRFPPVLALINGSPSGQLWPQGLWGITGLDFRSDSCITHLKSSVG
jgi:hypothetical protein